MAKKKRIKIGAMYREYGKYEVCGIDDKVTVKAMAEYMGVTEKTVRNRLKEHGGFWIDEGQVGKK